MHIRLQTETRSSFTYQTFKDLFPKLSVKLKAKQLVVNCNYNRSVIDESASRIITL